MRSISVVLLLITSSVVVVDAERIVSFAILRQCSGVFYSFNEKIFFRLIFSALFDCLSFQSASCNAKIISKIVSDYFWSSAAK